MFALTIADDVDVDQLRDMRTHVDGLVVNIKTMHEWLDSMINSSNERFDQIDLTQTANKTTLDDLMSCIDALTTLVTGDTEIDTGDLPGHARHAFIRGGNDSFAKIKFQIPPYNGKYDQAAYLDWELEVEQKFSCPCNFSS